MPSLREGQTVTVIHRTVTGQDERGNDVMSTTTENVDGCAISPGASSLILQGTEQVSADVTVHMPYGTNISADDFMVINGITYTVVGVPLGWQSPFTGTTSMVEVHGLVVTGGGPAS